MTTDTVNIAALFDQRVATCAQQAALIDATGRGSRTVSFAQLQEASMALARQLSAGGIRAGDRVLVAVPVSVALYSSLLALWRLGAVAVFPDPSSGREQLDYCCGRIRPRAFIGIPKAHLLRLLSPAVRRIARHYVVAGWAPFAQRLDPDLRGEALAPRVVESEAPALITFTSGSTGRPKAASRSHEFLLAQYRAIRRALDLKPGQGDVTTLPVFVLANLAAGVTTLLPPGDLRRPGTIDAPPILAAIKHHRIGRASGSPAFFQRLADNCTGTEPLLEQLHTGGAPVTPAMLDHFSVLARQLCAVYGSTEAEPIAELPARALTAAHRRGPTEGRGLPAGKPVPEIALRVIDNRWGRALPDMIGADLEALTQPAGEVGEIVVSGAHVLPGYLDGEGDDDTKFRVDGTAWHRTGDAGYWDDRGELWLLGRINSAVLVDGIWFYPFTLEYPAMAEPDVVRAALVKLDRGPVLALQWRAGSTPDIERLPLPKHFPREYIRSVVQIPLDRRHNAKVDYPALRRQLSK